jgi:translation initiation factor 2B subunit (eIF-2B alpha/beta/delta family)
VKKVGTRRVALTAQAAGVPVYVVAARDKIAPPPDATQEETARSDASEPRVDRSAVYRGEADLEVVDVLFERTRAELVAGVITEDSLEESPEHGALDAAAVADIARQHAEIRKWRER